MGLLLKSGVAASSTLTGWYELVDPAAAVDSLPLFLVASSDFVAGGLRVGKWAFRKSYPRCKVGRGWLGVGLPSAKCTEQIRSFGDALHGSPFL